MPLITQAKYLTLGDVHSKRNLRQSVDKSFFHDLSTHANLWAIVIETKRSSSNVLEALPQTLAYMMASQENDRPIYALCNNGTEFVFVKLLKGDVNQYALSNPFPIYDQDSNKLFNFVSILKHLAAIVLQNEN